MADPPSSLTWRLAGPPGPDLARVLPFAEAVRAAVMRAGNRIGLDRLPDAFHGTRGRHPHHHAAWLPEDRDDDGRIDHLTLHAPAGIPAELLPALVGPLAVWLAGAPRWSLTPDGIDDPAVGPLIGPARHWEPVTPFVTTSWRTDRHGRPRPGLDPEAQLRREIAQRTLPAPIEIVARTQLAGPAPAARFRTATAARRPPGDACKAAFELHFADPVHGPLALGFGAHFGLGLFRPVTPSAAATPPPPPSPPAPSPPRRSPG